MRRGRRSNLSTKGHGRRNLSTKGQVTIFIILGIVLLLTIAAFIIYRQELFIFKPEKVIPPEVAPLQRFVENCVGETSREGIQILAGNGGFIRFPDQIELDSNSYISTNPLFPEFKVPLWRYNGLTRYPTQEYVEEELRYYITENINNCLQDLESFEGLFDIEKGEMNVNIELLDKSTRVELVYPVKIINKQKNQTTEIDSFESDIPLRLKSMLELAVRVMEAENSDKFLEYRTLDLIALDTDIPYTDLEFTCEPRVWQVSDVRDKLKRLLRTDLPLIRVERTSYSPVPQDRPYEANHFIWEVTSLNYPNTHVSFTYDDYPMDFYVGPSNGNILRSNPQKGQDLMSFLCIHLWHFTYDVKYPVMVTLTDDAAGGHEKLVFNFGIQVGINHNVPDTTNFGVSTFDFVQAARDEEFCQESLINNIFNVHTFENISHEFDSIDQLPGVNITYTCIRMNCPLGVSETQFRGAIARLSTMAPYCINGVVRGYKDGYRTAETFASTNEENTVSLYLEPIINKNFTVKKHYIYSLDKVEDIEDDETAMITVKRRNRKTHAVYPTVESLSELELDAKWDHTYELEIYLIDDLGGIIGGYYGNWTPTWDYLKDGDIEFHVVEYPYDPDEFTQLNRTQLIKVDSPRIPEPRII